MSRGVRFKCPKCGYVMWFTANQVNQPVCLYCGSLLKVIREQEHE